MIHLFWSTCRPSMMLETYNHWMTNAVHPDNIKIHIVVDSFDMAEKLVSLNNFVKVFPNPRKGVVAPLYNLVKDFKGDKNDIMIVPSDDFYAPANWDMYLRERFEEENFRGVLKVNDGHMDDIISIPIMKYEAFEQMGRIIYHPAYSHMFCDKELHDTSQELGICRSVNKSDPEWEHRHPHFGTRLMDSHDESNNKGYAEGKEIYRKRRYMTLQERMVV